MTTQGRTRTVVACDTCSPHTAAVSPPRRSRPPSRHFCLGGVRISPACCCTKRPAHTVQVHPSQPRSNAYGHAQRNSNTTDFDEGRRPQPKVVRRPPQFKAVLPRMTGSGLHSTKPCSWEQEAQTQARCARHYHATTLLLHIANHSQEIKYPAPMPCTPRDILTGKKTRDHRLIEKIARTYHARLSPPQYHDTRRSEAWT